MSTAKSDYSVRKSGDNYQIYRNGIRVEGPPHATRATAEKYARIMAHSDRMRQATKTTDR